MAYISVPKDLNQIKSKFILGLTKRQTVCFGAAAAMGLPFFFFVRRFLPVSAAAFLMIIVMLPGFLFAIYERNGQPLEKFLKCVINTKFIRPKLRIYQTDNLYEATGRQKELYKEVSAIVSGKKTKR